MIDFFNAKYPDSNITDFNEGSEIRNLIEAIACDIFHLELNDTSMLRACFLTTSFGQYLDLFGEELNTARNQATGATGRVTFSISEPVTYNIVIPQDTVLVNENTGIFYNTLNETIIEIGETSADCRIYSQVPGSGTNADAETITLFQEPTRFPGVTVTNSNDVTGGTDSETDEEYRARLLEVKGRDNFGSYGYYCDLGLEVDGVHDVAIVDSASYTGKVLVNPYEKPLDEDILAEVTQRYTDQYNLVYNHSFEVEEVDYTDTPLEITVGVKDEVSDTIFEDLLSLFFNGGSAVIDNTPMTYPGLEINEPVTNYTLMTLIESLNFVVQVTGITSDSETFNMLTPDTNEVLKLGTVTITQNVVE